MSGPDRKPFVASSSISSAAVPATIGYDRTGSHVATGIGRVIDALIADGTLVDVGGQIRQQT